MKFVQKEQTNKLFRDEPEDPPEINQPTEVRWNHYPPGPIYDESGKKKIYTAVQTNIEEIK